MHDFWSAYFRVHLVVGLLPFWLGLCVSHWFKYQRWPHTTLCSISDTVARTRNWKALALALLCWFCLFLLIVKVF